MHLGCVLLFCWAVLVSLIFRPSQGPEDARRKLFPPLHISPKLFYFWFGEVLEIGLSHGGVGGGRRTQGILKRKEMALRFQKIREKLSGGK